MEAPSLFVALLAGLISFLSPCVLPLVPAYIGYLSGPAVAGARAASASGGTATMSTAGARWVALSHALAFVLGFTLVFVVVIGGMAGVLSEVLQSNKVILQRIMGLLLIVFGIHTLGLIRISFLDYTRRLDVRPKGDTNYAKSFLIGMGFGFGWTPCVGPTLGLIFTLAVNGQQAEAFLPGLAYSIGLGIPFLLTALAMGSISSALKKLTRRTYSLRLGSWQVIDQVNIISIVSGLLLIIMGLLIFSNALTLLTGIAPNFGI
ncbi:MAG TPA: cytochrome c biogenesis CcdA family protein [Chloroflexia bacterium]|nr:cytochrome c biogenesis CcdA family protein [Chloroflexia bacterium]